MEQQIKLWSDIDDDNVLWDEWDKIWLESMELKEKENA
jgi:hypothetical protein